MPGGDFELQAGRLKLGGGGQFRMPINTGSDTILVLGNACTKFFCDCEVNF